MITFIDKDTREQHELPTSESEQNALDQVTASLNIESLYFHVITAYKNFISTLFNEALGSNMFVQLKTHEIIKSRAALNTASLSVLHLGKDYLDKTTNGAGKPFKPFEYSKGVNKEFTKLRDALYKEDILFVLSEQVRNFGQHENLLAQTLSRHMELWDTTELTKEKAKETTNLTSYKCGLNKDMLTAYLIREKPDSGIHERQDYLDLPQTIDLLKVVEAMIDGISEYHFFWRDLIQSQVIDSIDLLKEKYKAIQINNKNAINITGLSYKNVFEELHFYFELGKPYAKKTKYSVSKKEDFK